MRELEQAQCRLVVGGASPGRPGAGAAGPGSPRGGGGGQGRLAGLFPPTEHAEEGCTALHEDREHQEWNYQHQLPESCSRSSFPRRQREAQQS